jgi:hypothetical protein
MFSQRFRFAVWAVVSIVAIWLVAMAGRWYLETRKVTAEKVRAYVEAVDFNKLAGDARAWALKNLEDKLNALSYEERQKLRGDKLMKDWFANMTEEEKAEFIEATMPTGFKQMIGAFEQMDEAKRKSMIDIAMVNLRGQNAVRNPAMRGTNAPPPISPELEAKIRTIGLNTFYSQSSAQTKAELAPLLEEMQRQMESGRMMRGGPRR